MIMIAITIYGGLGAHVGTYLTVLSWIWVVWFDVVLQG